MPTIEQNINKRLAKLFGIREDIIAKMNGEYDRELIKLYREKLKTIQNELAQFLGKLSDITIQEARKYDRLLKFEKALEVELKQLGTATKQIARTAIRETVNTSYLTTGYAVDVGIGLELAFGGINENVLRAALINPMDAIGWPDRTNANIAKLVNATRQAVTEGLIQGYGYKKTASMFKDKMEKSAYEAQRIIRTESNRAKTVGFNEGFDRSQKAAEVAGVDIDKIWDATLDRKTRPDHQAIDQKEADNEGNWMFPDGTITSGPSMSGVASQDINCRCSTRVQVKGLEPEFRIDNESKDFISIVDYGGWLKNKGL